MARACTICTHQERAAIDQALVVGGAMRPLAALYRVSPDAIERHAASHLPQALSKAQDAKEVAQGDDLLKQVRDLQRITMALLAKAVQANDLRTALQAVGQARGNLELLGKLVGQLQQEGTVNLVVSPQWLEVRATLISALAPFPEARQAVAGRLAAIEGEVGHAGAGR